MPVPVPVQSAPLQQRGGPPFDCGVHLNPGAHCPRASQRQPLPPTIQVDATPPPGLPPASLVPLAPSPLDPNDDEPPESEPLKLGPASPTELAAPSPEELPQAAKVSAPTVTTRPTTRGLPELTRIRRV